VVGEPGDYRLDQRQQPKRQPRTVERLTGNRRQSTVGLTGGELLGAARFNASFPLHLRDSGVRFIAADLPNTDETVVGIMAVIAQRERDDRPAHAGSPRRGP